jgi:6-phosphogluconolactonase
LPRFDLVLLGLGADAHTASLFPHSVALTESKWFVVNWVDKLNEPRLSLTYPVLNNAAAVRFLVAGGDKAHAVKTVLSLTTRTTEVSDADVFASPAAGIKPVDGSLAYWLDADAARDWIEWTRK